MERSLDFWSEWDRNANLVDDIACSVALILNRLHLPLLIMLNISKLHMQIKLIL